MLKYVLGAAAAFALYAAPVAACDDCKNCKHHQETAQADKKDVPGCHCKGAGPDGKCKCGDKCTCEHCKAAKAEKKDETKKS